MGVPKCGSGYGPRCGKLDYISRMFDDQEKKYRQRFPPIPWWAYVATAAIALALRHCP